MDVSEITKHGVPLLFRTPEALKSLNNKTLCKIEQNDLHFLVPSVPSLRFLAGQHSSTVKQKIFRLSLLFPIIQHG